MKDVLLVMIASGLFQADTTNPNANPAPPATTEETPTESASEEDFWIESWKIIDEFCPSLKEDVFAKLGRPLSPYINPLLLPSTPPPGASSPSSVSLPVPPSSLSPLPSSSSSPPPLTQEPPPAINLTQPTPEMHATSSSLPLSSSIPIDPAQQQEVGEPIPHFADSSSSFLNLDPQQSFEQQISHNLPPSQSLPSSPHLPNMENLTLANSDSAIYNNHHLYNYNNPGSSSPLAPHYPSS